MSARNNAIASNARDIKAHAAAFLEQRDCGDWAEADQAALAAWLAESSAHHIAYLRLSAAWARTERLVALRPPEGAPRTRAPQRALWRRLAGSAVALLAVAALGVTGANFMLQPRERIYATALGGHQTVRLDDGSRIELNTNTTLRAAVNMRHRTVWLDGGEAFFQIAHDTGHPFIVMAGDHRVTVLGTKFLVRRDTNRLEVAVVEGRVRFDGADGRVSLQSAYLTQGDVVVATSSVVSSPKQSEQALASELGWRRGVVVFDNTTLGEAAAEFNRYNQQKIVVDTSVANLTIGGTFRTSDIKLFARVAKDILGLRVETRGDTDVISR
ncbi:MAG TPA: FecR domain-containing protein [Rhizomicrobium sp.]